MKERPIRVVLLLFPNVTQFDLTGPAQVLSRLGGGAVIDLVWHHRDPVPTDAGFSIVPTAAFADVTAVFARLAAKSAPGRNDELRGLAARRGFAETD